MGNFEVYGFDLYFDNCKPAVAKHLAEMAHRCLLKDEEFREDYSFGMPTGEREFEEFEKDRCRITIMTEVRECDPSEMLYAVRYLGDAVIRLSKQQKHALNRKIARWIDNVEFTNCELYMTTKHRVTKRKR